MHGNYLLLNIILLGSKCVAFRALLPLHASGVVKNKLGCLTWLKSVASNLEQGDPLMKLSPAPHKVIRAMPLSALILTQFGLIPASFAADGQFGFLESKWAGMVHPIGMIGLYLLTLVAAYHGLQWRNVRELATRIKTLRSEANPDEALIASLQEQRSKILSGDHKDRHSFIGSILLSAGVLLSIEGGLSTWWRVGELFPGEHLFAGLGVTLCWAVAAALVPWMTKGNEWARLSHIGFNVGGLGLFTWQVASGLEIMLNVWSEVPGW